MSSRSFNASSSRYGFNGKEKDDENNVAGGSYDFGERIYDSRLGRWLSLDPLMRKYAGLSPYNFTFNNPIIFNDPDGRDGRLTVVDGKDGSVNITLETNIHIYGANGDAATAAALTKAYKDAGFDKTRSFKGADGKTYNVAIKVTYSAENAQEIKKQQSAAGGNTNTYDTFNASKLDKTNVKNFKDGDNVMEVDESKDLGGAGGFANTSGAVVCGTSVDKGKVHEPFHLLGFDEGYNARTLIPNEGMSDDVMGNYQGSIYNYSDGKSWVNVDFGIEAIHYVNLINFVVDNKKQGESVIRPVGNDRVEFTAGGTQPYSKEQINQANSSEIKKTK
jgi:RHS repeat-associated protein